MFIKYLYLVALSHILLTWLLAWLRGWHARRKDISSFALQDQPLISVLIPAWNERGTLARTLEALHQSDCPNREVIVIAGGPDGTYEYARQLCANWPNATVIEQPPRGKNAALNLGLQHAHGEIIVLLDADTLVARDWLSNLVAPLGRGYTATTANYFPLRSTWVSACFEMEKLAIYFIRRNAPLQGCGGIALQRRAIERIGGFPEEVTVGVDWDLWQRLAKQGGRSCFVPQAHARTALPATLTAFWRNQIRWRRAHLQTIFRHFRRNTAVGLSFYGMALAFLAAPLLFLAPGLWQLACIFWLWTLLRRLGLAFECAAFERQSRWLKQSWGLPLLLIVDFVAAVIALCTFRRRVVFFQGTRPPARGGHRP